MRIKLHEIRTAKYLSFVLLFHINISIHYYQIPNLLLLIGFLLGLSIFIFYIRTNQIINHIFPLEIVMHIIFFFFSLVSGFFVASNTAVLINTAFTLAQTIVLMICLTAITYYDNSLRYIELLVVGIAFLMSVVVLSGVGNLQLALAGREEMYKNSISKINPNSVGLTQVAAFFIQTTLMRRIIKEKKETTKRVFLIRIVFLFLLMVTSIIVVLISGSRKSFLAIVLVLIFTFIFSENGNVFKKLFSIFGSILVVLGLFWIGKTYLETFYIFRRFSTFFDEGSNTTRVNMIKEGLQLLKKSPFFGIGLGNYRYASSFGTYSHNTFAEALSTTGLLGSMLYFSTYLSIFYKLTLLTKKKLSRRFAYDGIVLYGILIFLGVGVIHFYSILSSLLFSYLIGGLLLSRTNSKRGTI